MKTKNPNKRRTFGAVLAVLLIIAIALTGTYAWQAFTPSATNEQRGTVNPGGRLHDYFDGQNKDVLVENFGNQSIYVRVRLTEYMEIGAGAGQPTGTAGKTATSIVSGAKFDDKSTWTPHVPLGTDVTVNKNGNFKDYWSWAMGGNKWYMPTFNQDKNSLKTDVYGQDSWLASNPDWDYQVTDNHEADLDGVTQVNPGDEAGAHNYFFNNRSMTGTEYLTGGTNNANVTHTAQQSVTATVITMQQWIDDGMQIGNFWVVDTDGWAYWASPLEAGKATGLLLNSIGMHTSPDDDWYYAIDVQGQFSTKNDLWTTPGFKDVDNGGITKEGENLLNKISGTKSLEELLQEAIDRANTELAKETDAPGTYTADSVAALEDARDAAVSMLDDIQGGTAVSDDDINAAIKDIDDNIPLTEEVVTPKTLDLKDNGGNPFTPVGIDDGSAPESEFYVYGYLFPTYINYTAGGLRGHPGGIKMADVVNGDYTGIDIDYDALTDTRFNKDNLYIDKVNGVDCIVWEYSPSMTELAAFVSAHPTEIRFYIDLTIPLTDGTLTGSVNVRMLYSIDTNWDAARP